MDSVFDLSPTEKLQFVEDLGDDLAAGPEQLLSTSSKMISALGVDRLAATSCARVNLGGSQRQSQIRAWPLISRFRTRCHRWIGMVRRSATSVGGRFPTCLDACVQRIRRTPEGYPIVFEPIFVLSLGGFSTRAPHLSGQRIKMEPQGNKSLTWSCYPCQGLSIRRACSNSAALGTTSESHPRADC
jgi:hypothetical protein